MLKENRVLVSILLIVLVVFLGLIGALSSKIKSQKESIATSQGNTVSTEGVFVDINGKNIYRGISRFADISQGADMTAFRLVGKIVKVPYLKENMYYIDLEIPSQNGNKKVLSVRLGYKSDFIAVNYTDKGVFSKTYTPFPLESILEKFVKNAYLALEITTQMNPNLESQVVGSSECKEACKRTMEEMKSHGKEYEANFLQTDLLERKTQIDLMANAIYFY